MKWNHTTL